MSNRIMNWAWRQYLPPTEKLLLLALANAADERETWCTSLATLASQCSVSTRTVQRLIRGLVAKDLIERHLRQRSDGSRTSNHYRLLLGAEPGMSEGHDTSVVAVRQGSQVLSEAEDMTAEFSHRLTVPHSGARSGQPAEFVGECNDESMRAAESPVRVTAAPIHPASPRAEPLFPELARVIG